jgi:exonuclease-1
MKFPLDDGDALDWIKSRVEVFLKLGIIPIMVFDGAPLTPKKRKLEEACAQREKLKKEADVLLKKGYRNQAFDLIVRSTVFNYHNFEEFLVFLKEKGVSYFVSPTEASAQLVYLGIIKTIGYIFSDNSEILLFEPTCPVCFQIFWEDSTAQQILLDDFMNHLSLSFNDFLCCCCFVGNNMITGIFNFGLLAGFRSIKKPDGAREIIERYGDESYIRDLAMAITIFRSAAVFDPEKKTLVHLRQPMDSNGTFRFLAPIFTSSDQLEEFVDGKVKPNLIKVFDSPRVVPLFGANVPKGCEDLFPHEVDRESEPVDDTAVQEEETVVDSKRESRVTRSRSEPPKGGKKAVAVRKPTARQKAKDAKNEEKLNKEQQEKLKNSKQVELTQFYGLSPRPPQKKDDG